MSLSLSSASLWFDTSASAACTTPKRSMVSAQSCLISEALAPLPINLTLTLDSQHFLTEPIMPGRLGIWHGFQYCGCAMWRHRLPVIGNGDWLHDYQGRALISALAASTSAWSPQVALMWTLISRPWNSESGGNPAHAIAGKRQPCARTPQSLRGSR